jgi:threonine aldolase
VIELRSDNAAGVAPEILAAIESANTGSALAYGADEVTEQLQSVVRAVFEHVGARVFPVTSGTAANALALSAATPPWGAVLCHDTAHILNSEGGATSLLGGGAVVKGVAGDHFLIDPAELQATLDAAWWGDPHQSQPSVLSFTQPSDRGTIYTTARMAELSAIAKTRDLRVHLDGARLANAIVALGCSPADITWRAGVDVVSLGATKNGALSCEAIITFDDRIADELVYRTKRAGHVTSKMRFQSAQMIAYLTDGLWLRLAANSNARMAELAAGLEALAGVRPLNRPDVNMLFVELPDGAADALEAGVLFYRMGRGPGGGEVVRFVTSWQTTPDEVAAVLERLAAAVGAGSPHG